MMLHTKYNGSGPSGFRQDCFSFPYICLRYTFVLLHGTIFDPNSVEVILFKTRSTLIMSAGTMSAGEFCK